MDEDSLQASIETYKQQLNQVETVLLSAGTDGQDDLLQLRKDLQEVIGLTEESLLSLKKSKLLTFVDDQVSHSSSHDIPQASQLSSVTTHEEQTTEQASSSAMDEEFAAFQAAIADDTAHDATPTQQTFATHGMKNGNSHQQEPTSSYSNTATDSGPYQSYHTGANTEQVEEDGEDDISGTKCSVFVTHEWGAKQQHNAVVLSVEPASSQHEEEEDDIQVRVLFCNPTNKSMLPCPYFLDDKCRFEQDECRFSHGHLVNLSELHEYHEHDYSVLTFESPCLARHSDNIWYPAVIESVEDDHQYLVKFQSYGTSETVGLDSIIPTGQRRPGDSSSSDDDDSEDDSAPSGSASRQDSANEDNKKDEHSAPADAWQPTGATSSLGDWEAHTRGIGSKLMAMMGYEFGKGLGKDGQGRRDIVEAVVYPQGKSLDKCMELRENNKVKVVGKKRKRKVGKGHQGQGAGQQKKQHMNVFDFINKKLGGKKVKIKEMIKQTMELRKPGMKSGDTSKKTTSKNLNVQLVKVHEEIKCTSKKLVKLKQTITRNHGDTVTINQVKDKVTEMEQYLERLHETERRIQRQQSTRDQHKKLTIF